MYFLCCAALSRLAAAGKDADSVDNDWFLCACAILDHAGPLLTSFPVENRLIPQVGCYIVTNQFTSWLCCMGRNATALIDAAPLQISFKLESTLSCSWGD
jgi:hypothetical protein